jgi:hypothetical protein
MALLSAPHPREQRVGVRGIIAVRASRAVIAAPSLMVFRYFEI